MLLLTAYSLYHSDFTPAVSAAIGIEMYHNHTLVHDDLMDHADVRRGRPTVHKRWNENTAVLSGDTMLLLAYRLIAQSSVGRTDEVMRLFTDSAIEICEGQQYDVNFESRSDVTEEEYLEMIRLKTSVLLGCAAKMGALLADAPVADCEVLYRFAERSVWPSNFKTTISMPTAISRLRQEDWRRYPLRQENFSHGFGLGANA